MKPEDVKPLSAHSAHVGYWVPAHEVGAIIKAAMACGERRAESFDSQYGWSTLEIAEREAEFVAWLAKADELEKMR
jgi:hypothetical protein